MNSKNILSNKIINNMANNEIKQLTDKYGVRYKPYAYRKENNGYKFIICDEHSKTKLKQRKNLFQNGWILT